MNVTRPATITVTARTDAAAVAHAGRVLKAPDHRWQMSIPVVISRNGNQRTVKATFTLTTGD